MKRATLAKHLAEDNGYTAEIKTIYHSDCPYSFTCHDYYHAYVVVDGEKILVRGV